MQLIKARPFLIQILPFTNDSGMHSYNPLILATQLVVVLTLNAQEKQPNIIYLMSDDQSIYSISCYGNIDVQTPNLVALADGITFDNHYVSTAMYGFTCKRNDRHV